MPILWNCLSLPAERQRTPGSKCPLPPAAILVIPIRIDTGDLPTALRVAGVHNLDVQIARQRLSEAQAGRQSALQTFFPWLAPGIS